MVIINLLPLSGFYYAAGLPALRRRDGFKLRSGSLNVHSLLLSEHQRQSQQTHSGSMDLNLGSPNSLSYDKVSATSCSLEGVDILSHMLDTFFSVEEKEHLAVQGAAQFSSRTVARIDSERSNRHHHHHSHENQNHFEKTSTATTSAATDNNCDNSCYSSNRHYQYHRQYHQFSMPPLAAAGERAAAASRISDTSRQMLKSSDLSPSSATFHPCSNLHHSACYLDLSLQQL